MQLEFESRRPLTLLLLAVCILVLPWRAARTQENQPLPHAHQPEARQIGHGKRVTVDAWFNSQKRTNAAGKQVFFHYKWDDVTDSGFSLFGEMFQSYGASLETLYDAPTAAGLKASQVYIVASPDIPAKNPAPHYATAADAEQIATWVRDGGTLLLMENDPANADIDHFNLIANRFGITFNPVLRHHVEGTQYEMGKIHAGADGVVFHHAHTLFMKDTCTISVKSPAKTILQDKEGIVIAQAKYGKGSVVAVVDPWLYNEYTDGHKLPAEYDNFAAGKEFAGWLLRQSPAKIPGP